ncbi:type I-E CRISPR-associated protein Cse1/CasA [Apilactobacillus timberlakei]|uniref:type I-E CRISPR-associated protein Cse2/CasB n=1 Tax=Apilactobacillus timberlakei TaxID=2008380 RepID=UPI0011275664|nr:type I-E CRISPR-associated protein Cse2/CasB [Apilactobacillus timberlakei]TPR23279.1 type I-E CRISPR-associated protein Cse1/CasA [Apilactobacillus timberlakei]
MGRYNLIDERWINVIDDNNELQKVSLKDVFKFAKHYKRLSGDTSSQDFAILRLLLSILETIFHRYNFDGQNQENTKKSLSKTWKQLWDNQNLPFDLINKYLSSQNDKFNLYDDNYPFFQVSKKDLESLNIKKTGQINGKLINRIISESNNKLDLFSPTKNDCKNKLTDASLARWLITFQGFTGTSDKAKYPKMSVSASKGWLLGLGGIYLRGNNLFQTLMLNLVLNKSDDQRPIWELSLKDKIHYLGGYVPNNLAELYTNSSRLIFIDPKTNLSKKDVSIEAVQLSGIDNTNIFNLEPMTLFQKPKSGSNKNEIIPKIHDPKKSLWRSFGTIEGLDKGNDNKPGVIKWLYSPVVRNTVNINDITIVAVGMTHNFDASSMPNGDIYDELNMNRQVLNDISAEGWIRKIYIEVERTQKSVRSLYYFAKGILELIGSNNLGLADRIVEDTYFELDYLFKHWVSKIKYQDYKNQYLNEWQENLKFLLNRQVYKIIFPITTSKLVRKLNTQNNLFENFVDKYRNFELNLNNIYDGEYYSLKSHNKAINSIADKRIYNEVQRIIEGHLSNDFQSSHSKLLFAELRKSINRNFIDYSPVIYPLLFENTVKDCLDDHRYDLTPEAQAIVYALELYAIHQQGNKEFSVNLGKNDHIDKSKVFNVYLENDKYYVQIKSPNDYYYTKNTFNNYEDLLKFMNGLDKNDEDNNGTKDRVLSDLGKSLNIFKNNLNNTDAIDKRFNRVLTANNNEEFLNELRHLIKIIKTNSEVKVSYPKLAEDIYNFMDNEESRKIVKLRWAQSYYQKQNNKEENTDEK